MMTRWALYVILALVITEALFVVCDPPHDIIRIITKACWVDT